MTDTIKISRELLGRMRAYTLAWAAEYEYRHKRDGFHPDHKAALAEADALLATPPADAADMGGQAGEEVPHQITIVQHLDIKGSRKALGAMNAKLRCKVGHLERKISEQCEELEILHKQLDRFRDGSHGIPALAEHERLSQELAQHRQQAGKLVEALEEIASGHGEQAAIAAKALADWEKTSCGK